MLEDYYVKPSTVDTVRASWLAPQIESYLEWLESHCYSRLVVYRRLPLLFHFAEFHRGRASGAGCRYQRHSCMAGTCQFGDYQPLCGNHSERQNGRCCDLSSSGRSFDNIAPK
jgi:hypothetical protein